MRSIYLLSRSFMITCELSLLLGQIIAQSRVQLQSEARHDESAPLSSIPKKPVTERAIVNKREHRVKPLPRPPATEIRTVPDKVRQVKTPVAFQATLLAPFPGIGDGVQSPDGTKFNVQSDPPDTTGAVGDTQYVEWVNTALAVFDKNTGKLVSNIIDGNQLFKGFGGDCENSNDGDPIVLYDKAANRWVLSQFAVTGGESTPGGSFSHCIAVSQTSDATGKYNRYEFKFQDFNDYPKMGVWPDGYYVSFNMFRNDAFLGSKACAFDRAKMLAGQAAVMQCFDVPNLGGLLPSDIDGPNDLPAGPPNFFLNFEMNGRQLNMWRFHVDWSDSSKTTFAGPTKIDVEPFTLACASCVLQPKNGIPLNTLGDRLMFRLAYRKFPDHDSLVVNHTAGAGSATGIRWYEIQNPNGAIKVAQQGTFAPDKNFRWMGSVAMDKVGNMAMGFSVSSKKVSPSIRFVGRNASDQPGVMSQEKIVQPGKGFQTDPDRWGDYASMTLDPMDDCTFYFATQFVAETGRFNWQTSIVRIRFPSCK